MPRTALISALFLVLMASPCLADRLGGAYRGPDPVPTHPAVWVGPGVPPGWPPAGYKGAIVDGAAYWPHYFEHNREWILADRIEARRRRSRGPGSSPPTELVDRIFPVLLKAADDPVAEVRDAAILALGKSGRKAAVARLTRARKDPDKEVREDALLALGLLRDGIPEYPDWKGFEAGYTSLALALAGDPGSLPVTMTRFKGFVKDGRSPQAAIAVAAMGHLIREEGIVDDVAIGLKRRIPGHPIVRAGICHALGLADLAPCRAWLQRAVLDKSKDVRTSAVAAMDGARTKRETALLLGKSGLRSGNVMTRVFAIHGLARSDSSPEVEKALVTRAQSPRKDAYMAQHAALALGMAGNKAANDTFLDHLGERLRTRLRHETLTAFAMALGFTGDLRAREHLEEIQSDRELHPDYRGYCALALALMDSKDSLELIRATLNSSGDSAQLAIHGAGALGLMGDETDVPYLLSVISTVEDDWFMARGAAATALGLISAEESIKPLIKLAETSEDAATRAFAVVALGWMVDRDPVPRIPLLFRRWNYRLRSPIVREVMSCL